MTAELPASQLSSSIVDEIEQLKGTFPGYRRAHARGVCHDATFVPSGDRLADRAGLRSTQLTPGIELSDDPVPAARSAIWAVSYDRRRHGR